MSHDKPTYSPTLTDDCSFWSELSEAERYQVDYRGKRWTGYNSLLACLRRALEDGVPVTTPTYWRSEQTSDAVLKNVFRSATVEQMPLIDERISILREAANVLHEVSLLGCSYQHLADNTELPGPG